MATNQRYAPNARHIAVTADQAYASGDPVKIGQIAGVAQVDAEAGEKVTVWLAGSYDLTVDGEAAEGDPVFIDAGALNTAGTGTAFGTSLGEKGTGSATLEVAPLGYIPGTPTAS